MTPTHYKGGHACITNCEHLRFVDQLHDPPPLLRLIVEHSSSLASVAHISVLIVENLECAIEFSSRTQTSECYSYKGCEGVWNPAASTGRPGPIL